MNAIDLLKNQHRLVEQLFERFENAKSQREKDQIFEEIAASLVGHDAIEREIFYPACEKAGAKADMEDVLGESLVEHGLVEFSVFRADKNRGKEDLEKYVTVLKEVVEHHVKEEERELLPKMKRVLNGQLDQLGTIMEARFEQSMESDYRRPLRNNLRQVLEGRMKTTKKPPKARTKKSTTKRRTTPKARRRTTTKRRSARS